MVTPRRRDATAPVRPFDTALVVINTRSHDRRTHRTRWMAPMHHLASSLRGAVAVVGLGLLSASTAYGQAPAWTSEMAASFRSPFTDAKTRLAVNAIGVETMLRLGYAPITDAGRKRLSALPGVESLSALEKVMPDRSVRVLEVGVSAAPAGGQNIQIFGATIGGGAPTSNPDFADLQQRLKATLAEVPLPAAPVQASDIRQYIYQPRYVQADRAIAVLKALGMSTIEFSKAAGDGSYESAYEPIRKGEAQLPMVVKLKVLSLFKFDQS